MRIYYDKEKSAQLMQRITDKFTKEEIHRTGSEIHVSDLCGCEVKAYCRITGVEQKKTKQLIGLMVFGIISEFVLAETYPKEERQNLATLPFLTEEENIYGHIDIFEDMKCPMEVKGSRQRIFKATDIPKIWQEQLMSYMALKGAIVGWLIIINFFSTQIMAFCFEMKGDETMEWIMTLNNRARRIRKAVKSKDPSGLEIRGKYGQCYYKTNCPRKNDCKDLWKEEQALKRRKKKEAEREKKAKESPLWNGK